MNRHAAFNHKQGSLIWQVNGERFHFAGFNNYYLPTFAADPHHLEERTTDVDVVFR